MDLIILGKIYYWEGFYESKKKIFSVSGSGIEDPIEDSFTAFDEVSQKYIQAFYNTAEEAKKSCEEIYGAKINWDSYAKFVYTADGRSIGQIGFDKPFYFYSFYAIDTYASDCLTEDIAKQKFIDDYISFIKLEHSQNPNSAYLSKKDKEYLMSESK